MRSIDHRDTRRPPINRATFHVPFDDELVIAARDELDADEARLARTAEDRGAAYRLLSGAAYRLTPRAASAVGLRRRGGTIDTLAALVGAGELCVVARGPERPIAAGRTRWRAAPPGAVPTESHAAATTWVGVRVVHHRTGQPFAGVQLTIRTPEGLEVACRTDSQGVAAVQDIQPGLCDVWCALAEARLAQTLAVLPEADRAASAAPGAAPAGRDVPRAAWVAHVDEHRVRTGDTLQSVAERHGFTWQELARFNWGTAVPDEVNLHLRDAVGCTAKTRDGMNYRFTSEDEPGLLFIPRRWSQGGLATGRTHMVRVRLAAGFRLILATEEGLRIPSAAYEATLADGAVVQGRLGRNGLALLRDPAPGAVNVRYPDLDDIEAKALAARARRALAERQPRELHRLFRYPRETVRRAIAAYDELFNDYRGCGLRHDIEAEFGADADAELVFFGYFAHLDSPRGAVGAGEELP